jgi:superfamily II DNA/RNA helicase
MLDMGFIPDVEKIVSMLPPIRNTLFFSATMPPEIRGLANKFLMNPKEISVAPPATTAETITQGLVMVNHRDGRRPGAGAKEKREALRKLIYSEKPKNALIFCNRKRDVDVVCRSLNTHGITASRLHGDMSQPARTETLGKFKSGEISLVVCSDVAARGLDIPNMSHVFNFDVPIHAEDYVHRIGRTGRAGRQGSALTIATPEDRKYLDAIRGITGQEIPLFKMDGVATAELENADETPAPPKRGRGPRSGGRGGRGGKGRSGGQGGERKPSEKTAKPEAGKTADSGTADDGAKKKKQADQQSPSPAKKDAGGKAKKEDSPDKGGAPVKGLGGHMPAFLMTSPPKKK